MPLYDFTCASGHVFEQRAGYDQSAVDCPECGAQAARGAVNRIGGVTGFAIPPMAARPVHLDRAVNAHMDLLAEAKRKGVEPPDFLAEAKRRARVVKQHAPELITGT